VGHDDIEHPDTLTEALAIEKAGGLPWVDAMGELVAVTNTLFDGPGVPAYIGASRQAKDILFEQAPHNGIRMFTRQFWSSTGESVIGAFCQKAQRPALMAIVPVGLDIDGTGKLDLAQATALALASARKRSAVL